MDKIQVLMVEPGRSPYPCMIDNNHLAMQDIVGKGLLRIHPFPQDEVAVVMSREARGRQRDANRPLPMYRKTVLSYAALVELFRSHEKNLPEHHLIAYICFSSDSFTRVYSERERTYVVSSNNKAFQPGKGGYSIFATDLCDTECIRLERHMAVEHGGEDGWQIEECYILETEPDADVEQMYGTYFLCGDRECYTGLSSLTDEQVAEYQKLFESSKYL